MAGIQELVQKAQEDPDYAARLKQAASELQETGSFSDEFVELLAPFAQNPDQLRRISLPGTLRATAHPGQGAGGTTIPTSTTTSTIECTMTTTTTTTSDPAVCH